METTTERLDSHALRTGAIEPISRGLGWFSLSLGLPQLLMPHAVSRLAGAPGGPRSAMLTRVVGMRELGAGIGILAERKPDIGLWSRVAGDGMDLVLLAAGMFSRDARRLRLLASMGVVGAITAADYMAAMRLQRSNVSGRHRIVTATTVSLPRQQVYAFWRDFSNLPRFMAHLHRVDMDGTRSHWVATAPVGTVEWDADIVEDVPGEAIAWRSKQGSIIEHSGRVEFADAPGDRGTEVTVIIDYSPPAGALGETFTWLFGEEPHQQVGDDLRRFKQVMETGEVAVSEGSPEGVLSRRQLLQRAAQPHEMQQPRRAA